MNIDAGIAELDKMSSSIDQEDSVITIYKIRRILTAMKSEATTGQQKIEETDMASKVYEAYQDGYRDGKAHLLNKINDNFDKISKTESHFLNSAIESLRKEILGNV